MIQKFSCFKQFEKGPNMTNWLLNDLIAQLLKKNGTSGMQEKEHGSKGKKRAS